MANESSKLHIFPCSNRTVNPEDNYVTQNNLTKVVKGLIGKDKDSFVVSDAYDDDPFCFFIKGYYVEISDGLRAFANIDSGDIYASVDSNSGYITGADTSGTQSFITFDSESGDLLLIGSNNKIPQSSRRINTPVVEAEKAEEAEKVISYDTINIETIDSAGIINIGKDSSKPTVDIKSTTTNISGNNINIKSNSNSGSSIVIGDSSNKSPVNINATTTNIDGNVAINGGTNINGNLIVGADNNRKTVTLKVNSFTATQGSGMNDAKIALYSGYIDIKAAPYPNGSVNIDGTLLTKNISPSISTGSTYDIGTSGNPFNNGYFNSIPLLNGTGMTGTGDAPLQGYDKTKGTIEERLTNLGFSSGNATNLNYVSSVTLKKLGKFVICKFVYTQGKFSFTLPEGFRPYATFTVNAIGTVYTYGSGNVLTNVIVTINSNGNVTTNIELNATQSANFTLQLGWSTDSNYSI